MENSVFNKLTEKMVGLPLNYAWRGYGSAIFLEFGALNKDKGRNHPQGEFSLMLDCDWRVERPRSIMFGSFCGSKRIENQLKRLLGRNVTNVEVIGYLPEIVVSLSASFRIVSFSSSEGQPDWSLFLADNTCLCCKRGKIVQER